MTAITVCWFALYAAVLGALKGIGESVVMVKPVDAMHTSEWDIAFRSGNYDRMARETWDMLLQFDIGPRGHVWHPAYHLIRGAYEGGLVVLGAWLALIGTGALFATADSITDTYALLSVFPYAALAVAVGWLCYEPAYSYGRYRRFDNGGHPEHVTFADLFSFRAPVWAMTCIRLALAAILMGVAL